MGYLNKQVMHISSNEVSSQNQLAIEGVAHKLYIYTQALEFYQYGRGKLHFYIPTIPCTTSNILIPPRAH